MLKTRFNRFAQVIEALFSTGVWSDSSGDWVFLHLPRLAGVTSARYLLLGAPKVGALGEHPVEACQVNPGLGTRETSLDMAAHALPRQLLPALLYLLHPCSRAPAAYRTSCT